MYLARDGDLLVLLFCGGTKKRQRADIAKALELHEDYKARKKVAARRGPLKTHKKR